ncbi:MAG: DUF4836 family protein [Bacteroidetes bacterium]|nr:DUF4836 family protein [Bacteroidota bacterium]
MKTWLKASLITAGIGIVGSTVYYFLKNDSGNELLTYVPNNVGVLVKFDLPEIGKALEPHKKEILELEMFKDKDLKNQDVLFKTTMNILKDPQKSGIDFKVPAMFYMESRSRGDASAFILKLEDESLFSEYMSKNIAAGAETGKEKEVHFAESGTGNWISWNSSVVLITNQKTEDKSYFQNILNKKNPGARGNLLLSRIVEQKGIVSAIFILDELTSSHALTRMAPAAGAVKNPLPAGTAILANLYLQNSHLKAEASLISLNEKKLNEITIFKKEGRLGKHKDALFNGDQEIAAYSVSLDIPKVIKLVESMSGSDDNENMDEDTKLRKEKLKENLGILQGDMVVGVSLRSALLPDSNAVKNNTYERSDIGSVLGIIAYISIQPDQKAKLENNLMNLPKDESGNYTLIIPYLNWTFKARIIGDELVLSDNMETLQQLASNTFHSPKPKESLGLKEHLKSPFYIGIASNLNKTISALTGIGNIPGADLGEKLYSGPVEGYVENGKFQYSVNFRDTKTHPLIQYLRVLNESFKHEKEMEAKTKELLKSMGVEDNSDY